MAPGCPALGLGLFKERFWRGSGWGPDASEWRSWGASAWEPERLKAKEELRRRFRAWREGLDPRVVEELSSRVRTHLRSFPPYRRAKSVLFYCPFRGEVDVWPLLLEAQREGKRVLLPVVRAGRMEAAFFQGKGFLRPGAFGILEPREEAPRLPPGELDLVLVPGLAFDEEGFRLGFGQGYYDRFLVSTPAFRLGVAYAAQVVKRLPRTAGDLAVHALVTEEGVRHFA